MPSLADSYVAEMEKSDLGKSVLLNSIEWLEVSKSNTKSETHKLNKIIFLLNLKLQKNDITENVS